MPAQTMAQLAARITALETRATATEAGLKAETATRTTTCAGLAARVAALEAGLAKETADRTGADAGLAAVDASLEKRIAALEAGVPVDPDEPPVDPPVPVPDGAPTMSGFPLVGRFRLADTMYARGAVAIDFKTGRTLCSGHAQYNELYEYVMLPESQWSKQETWWDNSLPAASIVRKIPDFGWTEGKGLHVEGLAFIDGKLWVSPVQFYDMEHPDDMNLHAESGEVINLKLARQHFAGFVKSKPGVKPLLGCGGPKSGQGFAFGPTAADWTDPAAPRVLVDYPFNEVWEDRPFREAGTPEKPDYTLDSETDQWFCMKPRMIDGKWTGKNSDGPKGGGLAYPDGSLHYWLGLGTGAIDYHNQNTGLCDPALLAVEEFIYRKDAAGKYVQAGWKRRAYGRIVLGQEVDDKGRIYLVHCDPWGATDLVVEVTDPSLPMPVKAAADLAGC